MKKNLPKYYHVVSPENSLDNTEKKRKLKQGHENSNSCKNHKCFTRPCIKNAAKMFHTETSPTFNGFYEPGM